MSQSELQSDRTNAGAAASPLKCAKKALDTHRQFIDDLIAFEPSLFSNILMEHYLICGFLVRFHFEAYLQGQTQPASKNEQRSAP
jgi:hypothetical protein